MKKGRADMIAAMSVLGGRDLFDTISQDHETYNKLSEKDRKWFAWNNSLLSVLSIAVYDKVRHVESLADSKGQASIPVQAVSNLMLAAACLEVVLDRLEPFAVTENLKLVETCCGHGRTALKWVKDNFADYYAPLTEV